MLHLVPSSEDTWMHVCVRTVSLLCLPPRRNGLQAIAHAADGEAAFKLPGVVDGEALAAPTPVDQRAKVDFTGRRDFVPEHEDAMKTYRV